MFNPDITKQAHEVIFSAKNTKKKKTLFSILVKELFLLSHVKSILECI